MKLIVRRYWLLLLSFFFICACVAQMYNSSSSAKIWKMSDNDIYALITNKITVGTSEEMVLEHLGKPEINKASPTDDSTYLHYWNPNSGPYSKSKSAIGSIDIYLKNQKVVRCKVQNTYSTEMTSAEPVQPQTNLNRVSNTTNRICIYTLFTNDIGNLKAITNVSVQGWISSTPDVILTNITSLNTQHITKRVGLDITYKGTGLLIGLSNPDKTLFHKYTELYNGYTALLFLNNMYITKSRISVIGETDTLQILLEKSDEEKTKNAFFSILK